MSLFLELAPLYYMKVISKNEQTTVSDFQSFRMERNRIQIPGASPADANWGCARWGFTTWNELFNGMCGEESEYNSILEDGEDNALDESMEKLENDVNCILNGTKPKLITNDILNEPILKKRKMDIEAKVKSENTSIGFDISSLQCMQPFRNEPKQQKITFPSMKDNAQKFNPNEPSTSTAYFHLFRLRLAFHLPRLRNVHHREKQLFRRCSALVLSDCPPCSFLVYIIA